MKKQFYRVKQLADQTFSRSGKAEALTDELQTADRKVEHFRNALQLISKKMTTAAGSTQGQDPAAREKRLKKLAEYNLGLSMCEASNFDDDDSILKYILAECGKTEKLLANHIAEHEVNIEQLVCAPLSAICDQDLPAIMKAKKQLTRLISEKESAANRYHHLERQLDQNPSKLSLARDELEEAGLRVEAARDSLAVEMFALVAKEAQLAHTMLQYVKLQRAYHDDVLHTLQDIVPDLEKIINDSSVKPVFGYPLHDHLRVTGRTIAYPIELCVCTLHELALNEEGLFRIAGGTSRIKRMKLSINAGLFSVPLPREYRDVHVVASVLKSYLRELPEPLLTRNLYDTFLNASKYPNEQARLNGLWEAIHLLPEANYQNLRYLIKFLAVLTQNQSKNKMTPSNLAIVMAPNLLWTEENTFDMNATTAVHCAVELLVKHADWFFKDDINFFITMTKDDLLPELSEYGFTPSFVQGYNQTAALNESNGDFMTKSLYDYSLQKSDGSGKHSRSNSHDTSLILLDNEIKKAQSNSSLSDQSSPPHGSPKPVTRRKNKPLAPVPPNFTEKGKNKSEGIDKEPLLAKLETDKPAKPPRPLVPETNKIISGVQTINRSTYRQSKAQKEELKTGSRENLSDIRRQSLELEKEKLDNTKPEKAESTMVVKNMTAQSGVVARMKVIGDNGPPIAEKPNNKFPNKVQARPVAAPRTIVPMAENDDVQLRNKPAVPERPATLRPQSFRQRGSSDNDLTPTVLERTHIYTVDKQHPTVIEVGQDDRSKEESKAKDSDSGDECKTTVQRTHSSGGKDDIKTLSSQSRQLSQSEGSITDVPASPRPLPSRPPRPQLPAPPPPPIAPVQDSTDL